MLRIDYRDADRRALFIWDESDINAPWLDVFRRLILDSTDDAAQENAYRLSLPWWNFISLRSQLLDIFKGYQLEPERGLEISSMAADLLRQSKRAAEGYSLAREAKAVDPKALLAKLGNVRFQRALSPEQVRNVIKISSLPAAATFSVPGAGKTTEALAMFFYKSTGDDRLLVIAPKNAFAAWDEQLSECMPHLDAKFTRLRGGIERIEKLLDLDPPFMLITYQQLARVSDLLAAHCAKYKIYVFLDESHRIKSGVTKQTARATLELAHLPIGKLIMSGTPMPQSVADLIPQFIFLYPEIPASVETVVELMRPVYVRTNKKELNLPPLRRILVPLPMAPLQHELYKLMKFEVAREAATALTLQNKQAFRSLGRSVARLMQLVSNPALLSSPT
jgi:hypothetical protein